MINRAQFEASIYTWASGVVTPTAVIYADQATTRPALPYVTIKVLGVATVGEDHEGPPDVLTDEVTLEGPRLVTVTLEAFGPTSMDLLDKLKTSLQKTAVRESLAAANISYLNAAGISDITVPLDTVFEPRATMDVRFLTGSSEVDTIAYTLDPTTAVADGVGTGQINITTTYN